MNARVLLSPLLIFVGLILVLDELGNGFILGDWSYFHIEPLHHRMLGAVMVIGGIVLARGA